MLVEHCYACHSVQAREAKKLQAKLFLDTAAGVLAGGDNGPALVAGKPAESLLIKAIKYDGDVVIESFTTDVKVIARAAAIWRKIEPSNEDIAVKGVKFLKKAFGK